MLTNYWRSGRFSGVLPVANGGTNSTTLTANKVMVGNGTSGVLTPTNLHWDNTNSRLGIETGSPNAKLEINDASTNSILRISSGTNNSLRGLEWYNNNSANVYGSIKSDYTSGVFIYDAGNSVYAGVHAFRIGTSGEAMRITSAGNVGIGTPSPGNLLTIKDKSQIGFRDEASNYTRNALQNYAYTSGYGDGLRIGEQYNAVSIGGNVGIGTTNPTFKLDVTGTGRFSADVTSSGASQNLFIADGTTYSGLRLNRAGVAKWAIFNNNAGTDFLDFYWYGSSPGTKFKIEPTGAATFSSTIKVGDGAASSNIEKLMVNTVSGTSAGIQLFQDGVESWIIKNPASSTALTFSASNQTRLTIASTGAATLSSLATGTVYSSSGTLTNTPPSDERLKNNINNISWGLSDILKLRPVSFNWKDDKISQGKQFGFIAQEVREVMPEAIKIFGEDVKYLGLEKDAIYATLVKAVQELSAQVDMLKQEIINLKNK
jgi:hypothetical protein